MRVKKIVVGLAAVAAVVAVAACSANSAADGTHISTAADTSSVVSTTTASTPDSTTSSAPTTSRTTTAPKTTPKPPATTKQATVPQAVTKIPGDPCSALAKACVDLSAHKAWLVQNGKVVLGPVSVMPGRPGHRTPTGTFHVLSHVANYYSKKYKAPMPMSTFFAPGIAFHVGSLYESSHGCVHMSRTTATKFYDTLKVGDEVQIIP